MNQDLLPKDFFKKNPLNQYSAAMFADLSIRTVTWDDLNEKVESFVSPNINAARRAKVLEQKKQTDALQTPEEIVSQMRKKSDTLVNPLLCKKAIAIQDQVMPLILKRYKTTFQTCFVESAVRIFGNADRQYTIELWKQYKEIRNPYAQSMACVVFGAQELEEAVPLLLAEYERMKKDYPSESYSQGPLLAIYKLYGMA